MSLLLLLLDETGAAPDSPLPQPLPEVVYLRDRHDYETVQQPRRLLDLAVVQSVDSPPGFPAAQLYERLTRFAGQQARGLDVSILAPVIVADNPTGNVTQALIYRFYPRQAWQQRGLLDVSVTQSVDVPPGMARLQPWTTTPPSGAPWRQTAPGYIDIAVAVPFTPQAYQRRPRPDCAPWMQARQLDVSVTQSLDSPPGYYRQPPATTRPASGAQWLQAGHGLISAPDAPNAQFNPYVYARQVAATQAWQKSIPVLHLITVEAPPLSGPYPMAPYRRPAPIPPVLVPAIAALETPFTAVVDTFLHPVIRWTRPDVYISDRPATIRFVRPSPADSERPNVTRSNRPGPQ